MKSARRAQSVQPMAALLPAPGTSLDVKGASRNGAPAKEAPPTSINMSVSTVPKVSSHNIRASAALFNPLSLLDQVKVRVPKAVKQPGSNARRPAGGSEVTPSLQPNQPIPRYQKETYASTLKKPKKDRYIGSPIESFSASDKEIKPAPQKQATVENKPTLWKKPRVVMAYTTSDEEADVARYYSQRAFDGIAPSESYEEKTGRSFPPAIPRNIKKMPYVELDSDSSSTDPNPPHPHKTKKHHAARRDHDKPDRQNDVQVVERQHKSRKLNPAQRKAAKDNVSDSDDDDQAVQTIRSSKPSKPTQKPAHKSDVSGQIDDQVVKHRQELKKEKPTQAMVECIVLSDDDDDEGMARSLPKPKKKARQVQQPSGSRSASDTEGEPRKPKKPLTKKQYSYWKNRGGKYELFVQLLKSAFRRQLCAKTWFPDQSEHLDLTTCAYKEATLIYQSIRPAATKSKYFLMIKCLV
jgi:hypothetical protein